MFTRHLQKPDNQLYKNPTRAKDFTVTNEHLIPIENGDFIQALSGFVPSSPGTLWMIDMHRVLCVFNA
jgi:hypothetical protein